MLAVLQPDSGNLPLFLHVLGAAVLFGATATVAIAGLAGLRLKDHAPLLSRLAFRTWLLAVVPSWILMRVTAEWILGKEFPDKAPGWVDVGFTVSEGGGLLLLVLGAIAWRSARREGTGRAATVVPWLASIVVLALGVAVFAMSAKP
jgi:hypothetical protein